MSLWCWASSVHHISSHTIKYINKSWIIYHKFKKPDKHKVSISNRIIKLQKKGQGIPFKQKQPSIHLHRYRNRTKFHNFPTKSIKNLSFYDFLNTKQRNSFMNSYLFNVFSCSITSAFPNIDTTQYTLRFPLTHFILFKCFAHKFK